MKTLAELRTEIDLGMKVYPTTKPGITVDYVAGYYSMSAALKGPDGEPSVMAMGYPSLDDLIADDIFDIASQPVWSTLNG